MSARTVQEIMGHANYNTTVSYTHVLDDVKQMEANKVGNFFEESRTQKDIEATYNNLIGLL